MSKVEEARQRRQQKIRATRSKQMLLMFLALATVIGLAVGGYYLINSDLFLLKSVSITGNKHVTTSDVMRMGGLDDNTNLMKISRTQVEVAIKKDPWIAEAQVTRDLPNYLDIVIVERAPFAQVKQGTKLYSLDKQGYVIEVGTQAASDTIPVIDEIKAGRLKVGQRAKSKLLRDALKSLAAISPELSKKIIWISVPSLDKLAFHTTDDLEIIYGSADEAEKKNLVIKKILAKSSEDVVHINVTAPDNPVVRKLKI